MKDHDAFVRTFVYGITVHGSETITTPTESEIPIPPGSLPPTLLGTATIAPTHFVDSNGSKVEVFTTTTVTSTAVKTVTKIARTTNPFLPMLSGLTHVQEVG